ncbi:unnamed protein product [Phaeothamnion confervicola]
MSVHFGPGPGRGRGGWGSKPAGQHRKWVNAGAAASATPAASIPTSNSVPSQPRFPGEPATESLRAWAHAAKAAAAARAAAAQASTAPSWKALPFQPRAQPIPRPVGVGGKTARHQNLQWRPPVASNASFPTDPATTTAAAAATGAAAGIGGVPAPPAAFLGSATVPSAAAPAVAPVARFSASASFCRQQDSAGSAGWKPVSSSTSPGAATGIARYSRPRSAFLSITAARRSPWWLASSHKASSSFSWWATAKATAGATGAGRYSYVRSRAAAAVAARAAATAGRTGPRPAVATGSKKWVRGASSSLAPVMRAGPKGAFYGNKSLLRARSIVRPTVRPADAAVTASNGAATPAGAAAASGLQPGGGFYKRSAMGMSLRRVSSSTAGVMAGRSGAVDADGAVAARRRRPSFLGKNRVLLRVKPAAAVTSAEALWARGGRSLTWIAGRDGKVGGSSSAASGGSAAFGGVATFGGATGTGGGIVVPPPLTAAESARRVALVAGANAALARAKIVLSRNRTLHRSTSPPSSAAAGGGGGGKDGASSSAFAGRKRKEPGSGATAGPAVAAAAGKEKKGAGKGKGKKTEFCLFFNRFGRCNKGDGCTFLHDKSKVAVCSKFLRGECQDENCLLTHEVCSNFVTAHNGRRRRTFGRRVLWRSWSSFGERIFVFPFPGPLPLMQLTVARDPTCLFPVCSISFRFCSLSH